MKKLLLFITLVLTLTSFKEKELSWLALGDSITYLNDHLPETGNRVSKGYLTRVTEQLPYIHYINQGHNGWTAVKIADEIEKLGLVKADIYTVFLGTNDWWHGLPLGSVADYKNDTGNKTVYGAYRTIINKLRNLNPDAEIILITPMQRADFVSINNYKNTAWGSYKDKDGQWLSQFAAAVKTIGKLEHLKVIDLYGNKALNVKNMVRFKRLRDSTDNQYVNYPYPEFTRHTFHPDTDEYPYPPEAMNISYDGLHPSDKGNAIIAGLLVKELKHSPLTHL